MRHWIHVSLLEMVSRALLPMGMGWLADSRSEVSVYPDGPEVAEEYPSVIDLVHRVRYLEQRLTSSDAEPGNQLSNWPSFVHAWTRRSRKEMGSCSEAVSSINKMSMPFSIS